jgi:Rod binding domain-containing protein
MELAALHSSRPASDLPLEQLAGNASLTEAQKIAEGARQFEALLLRQILQESQKTVFQSKFTDNSTAAGIYRDLVTQQLAESISKSGSLGLAKSLEGQLQAQRTLPTGQNSVLTAPPTAPSGGLVARPPFVDAPLGAASSKCLPPTRGVAIAPAHLS